MLTSPCTMCPSNYCVTFQELLLCKLQSICCQAQSWVCPPPPFLHLHRGSSLGLWCSSCLVHIFSASSLKSLPLRTQRSAWWNHPHTVYIAPHNTVSHGRASVSQPSVCALNGISLCMALPKLLHSELEAPSSTYIRHMFYPLTFAQIIHYTGVFVCVLGYVYVAKHACLWWELSTRIKS